jgi:hypothetical protein
VEPLTEETVINLDEHLRNNDSMKYEDNVSIESEATREDVMYREVGDRATENEMDV